MFISCFIIFLYQLLAHTLLCTSTHPMCIIYCQPTACLSCLYFPPGPMSPSIHPPTQQTSPLAPITRANQMINSQSQITIDNTLKDKFSNSPTPTDKVKTGANINKNINYCCLVVSLICLSFINYNLLYCCFISIKLLIVV